MLNDELGQQLVGWGKVVRLETRGRTTGRRVEVAIGYVEEPDGSIVVAAGNPDADWVRNLEADPSGRVTLGEATWPVRAHVLGRPEAAHAVRELILRYGTPAERLGQGPAFRLVRTARPGKPTR